VVADLPGLLNHGQRKGATKTMPSELRANVEPLHFAIAAFERSKGNTACWLLILVCEEKSAIGWCIDSWKVGQFLIEVLKSKINAHRRCIFQKKLPEPSNLFFRPHLDDFHFCHLLAGQRRLQIVV
jgi:hypothetical protein